MLKKTAKYLVVLLKKLRKLIRIPHSSEVASVFSKIKSFLKMLEPCELVDLLSSFFLMVASVGLVVTLACIIILIGG